ncbi:Lrp/AsnC family transcriptional regulator [Vallitalea pronyensis]|uniref:Lrp/AsnC family transcriptional regulator n=1 Tax=Vallitalea pronyensis TaxID=1348613 RepID=A0A8J8MKT6_9FIRM|nr:Lrp/AsnC family transcriptional regulator [Vallitalea pronyensis]QUI23133.1 Lrp/AsnC family transcriptional regulator [Vallitalea pronyensis]
MDTIDLQILRLLQKNARVTVSEISHQINLSISAVSDRLKKLESTGIIEQYTAIINPNVLHRKLTAIMFIAIDRPQYTDAFTDFVKENDEILDCLYIAGEYDYSLKIVTKDTFTLERLLNQIKAINGIKKTKTNVVLSTVKNAHSVVPSIEEE